MPARTAQEVLRVSGYLHRDGFHAKRPLSNLSARTACTSPSPGTREHAILLRDRDDEALAPLLEELIAHADSVWVREGAAHVLSKLGEHVPNIRSVLAAMNGAAPLFEVPVAAFEALRDLRNQPPASSIPE